jgi:two-component system, NarL family, response regulator LiaR
MALEKTRISIVDDNKVIRDSVMKFIGLHEEFEVGGIHQSAFSFLESFAIQAIDNTHILLLDIGMPRLSGIDAIPLILKKEPEINIVILTTYEEEEIILKALCAGACAYISKRGTMEEIITALRIVAAGGSYMSPSIAREIVNHLMGGKISKATILSDRQKEILQKLVDGKSYQTIAAELFLSVETVRSHIKKMYKVLQVNNKTEAITQYMRGHIK